MIKVEHLSKKYGDLIVLKDISTEIKKGEVVSIIGPSGTGKSTFLRCLNLLDQPTSGSISIDGEDILDKKTLKDFKVLCLQKKIAKLEKRIKELNKRFK